VPHHHPCSSGGHCIPVMTHTKIITINFCGIGQSMLVPVSLVVAWFHFVFAAVVIVVGIQKNKNNN